MRLDFIPNDVSGVEVNDEYHPFAPYSGHFCICEVKLVIDRTKNNTTHNEVSLHESVVCLSILQSS